MNTASLELSKELYELSGWKTFPIGYCIEEDCEYDDWIEEGWCPSCSVANGEMAGAYDLGFLLRKLPKLLDIDGASFSLCLHTNVAPPDWTAYYMFVQVVGGKLKRFSNRLKVEANTPEDAVCKLAIEIIKQGVLKR